MSATDSQTLPPSYSDQRDEITTQIVNVATEAQRLESSFTGIKVNQLSTLEMPALVTQVEGIVKLYTDLRWVARSLAVDAKSIALDPFNRLILSIETEPHADVVESLKYMLTSFPLEAKVAKDGRTFKDLQSSLAECIKSTQAEITALKIKEEKALADVADLVETRRAKLAAARMEFEAQIPDLLKRLGVSEKSPKILLYLQLAPFAVLDFLNLRNTNPSCKVDLYKLSVAQEAIRGAQCAYDNTVEAQKRLLNDPASPESMKLPRLRESLKELQTKVEVISPQLAVFGNVYKAVAADIRDHIAFLELRDVDEKEVWAKGMRAVEVSSILFSQLASTIHSFADK